MENAGARRGSPPKRILAVRLGAIGDCLRVLPAVARIREAFPSAEIGWATGDLAAPLLEGHPAIDRLHVVRRREMKAGVLRACSELHRVGTELADRGYDVAIDFHTRLKSGYLVRASRAPLRIGFDLRSGTEANFLFTNCHVTLEDRYENRVTRFERLLVPLGLETRDGYGFSQASEPRAGRARNPVPVPGFWVSPIAREWAATAYADAGAPEVAVFAATSASRSGDRWPAARWRRTVARLGDEGLRSMVLWGPGDEAAAREIAAASGSATLAPPTTLPQMAALLGCFGLYVGANTAALHMAWMQGVPSVVLAGGRPHRTDRPLPPVPSVMLSADGVEPVRKLRGEAARRAVEGIAVDDVVSAALRLVRRGGLP